MDPTSTPRPTVLRAAHEAAGATLVDFHGWLMPIRYGAIPEEHQRVRESAGLFDLCHMGRLHLSGPEASTWLGRVLTFDPATLKVGRARYGLILAEDGGAIDDAILYRLADDAWLLVVNASNREAVIGWMEACRPTGDGRLEDRTESEAMIAVQGPRSPEIIARLVIDPSPAWASLRYYRIASGRLAGGSGSAVRVARTGYTGEDGFEVYLPREDAEWLWAEALRQGGDAIAPIGLGARDTLRLEAGMPLYGHELDRTTNPLEAGLDFAVDLDGEREFFGKAALLRAREEGVRRRLRGFRVDGRRIAREGMAILLGDRAVGRVTSGAPSPTLGLPIAMGYIDVDAEREVERGEAALDVDLRGKRERIIQVALPFYSRKR